MLYDDSSENSSSSDEDDLDNLLVDFMFPPTFCPNYSRLNLGMEALMVLLRPLAYPNRWCDLESTFGRSQFELSLIFNKVHNAAYESIKIRKFPGYVRDKILLLT